MVKMSSSTAIWYFFHLPTMLAPEDMIWGHSLAARFLTRVPTVARTAGDLHLKKKPTTTRKHDYLTHPPPITISPIPHVLQKRWSHFLVQVCMWYVQMWSWLRVVHLATHSSFQGISERITFFSFSVMPLMLTDVFLKGKSLPCGTHKPRTPRAESQQDFQPSWNDCNLEQVCHLSCS